LKAPKVCTIKDTAITDYTIVGSRAEQTPLLAFKIGKVPPIHFLFGSLPAATGRKMKFTGTTVLRVENGKIVEEVGLDDGVTALQQLGLIRPV
jgi:SnoaL-like polyketide cyclase